MHPARRPEVKGGAATGVERRTGRLPETSKIDDLRQVGFLTDRQLAGECLGMACPMRREAAAQEFHSLWTGNLDPDHTCGYASAREVSPNLCYRRNGVR